MIEELANVVLTTDMPERGLVAGDIGTVVMMHQQGKYSCCGQRRQARMFGLSAIGAIDRAVSTWS